MATRGCHGDMENDRGNHQKFIGDIRRDIVGIYGMMGFIMCVYIYTNLYIYMYILILFGFTGVMDIGNFLG